MMATIGRDAAPVDDSREWSDPAAVPAPPRIEQSTPPAPVVTLSCPKAPQRAVLVLSVLLATVLALLAGYIIGVRSNWLVARISPPVVHPKIPAQAPEKPEPMTKTVIIRPPPEEPKKPEPVPPNASAAAEAALKAFLGAPDWSTRSAYVMDSANTRAAMEAHSQNGDDGPVSWQSVSLVNSHTDTESGNTTFVFKVVTTKHPDGIPVAVVENPSGWLVDWQTFVEFHDDLFKRFADGPPEQTGRFHLIVSNPSPERAARTADEHFGSFIIEPPIPDRQQLAYVRKDTDAHLVLSKATASGAPFTPVLEITKKTSPEGKNYLEILAVKRENWLPETD